MFSGFPLVKFFLHCRLRGSSGSPSCLRLSPLTSPSPQRWAAPRQTRGSLTQCEREHLLYSVKGNALLVRQGDQRPRKIRIKPHKQALT